APAGGNLAPIELADDVPDAAPTPAAAAERSAERAALEECLQQLDDRRRSLIRVAFFEGATYEELAAREGSPLGSVKSWIRRGIPAPVPTPIVVVPPPIAPAPVVTLASDAGAPAYLASLDLEHARVRVMPVPAAPDASGRVPELWLIPAGEKPRSLGVIDTTQA